MLLRVGDRHPELTAVEVLEIRQHFDGVLGNDS